MRALDPQPNPSTGPQIVDLPDPEPAEGEVLVQVRATALNRADLLQSQGAYPPPPGESRVPGLECAGEVIEIGAGVTEWARGDRVMALLAGGGHATRCAIPVGQAMPIPEGWSFTEAAGLPEVAITAWTNLVVEGSLARGQKVLITGAASGVGSFAVQLARELGAEVVVAGRDLGRLERLRALGADHCIELGEDLAKSVRQQVSEDGVDLVLDLVGGQNLESHLGALRVGGRLVLVGLMAGARSQLDLGRILRNRLRIIGSVLRARSREEKAGLVQSFHDFARERLEDGRLRPVIDRVLPFEDLPDAYRALAAGGIFGKIVLENEA